jgi:hypothetical protein
MDEITHYNGQKVLKKECRFAVYVEPPNFANPDLHFVKLALHLEDGSIVPATHLEWDYERPFWYVKKGQQDYKQYLDYIEQERCDKVMTTQTQMVSKIARRGGNPRFRGTLRDVLADPYVFGADIKSTSCIKKDYKTAYPGVKSEFTVAVFDIETDMLHGTDESIMATISFKDKCLTVVKKSFIQGILEPEKKLRLLLNKYLGKEINERNVQVEFMFVDFEIETFAECFRKAHEWMPDFVTIWNQKFDVGKFLEACERNGADPAKIMCDPSVPDEYKFFKFKVGPASRKTAKGLEMPIKPAAQWHTAFFPASFYIMDSMCTYKHTRIGKQEEVSYALDYILKRNGFDGKLDFKEADGYTDAAWHIFMQKNYPLEYIIYNIADCIRVEVQEEKIKDLSVVIQEFSDTSDFEDFKSQPRRKCDELHWFMLERGYVIGCTNGELRGELDKLVLGREDWIITLANSLVAKNDNPIILENPDLPTTVWCHNGDLDVRAS